MPGNGEQRNGRRQDECRSQFDLGDLHSAANSPDRGEQKEKQGKPRQRLYAKPRQAKYAGQKGYDGTDTYGSAGYRSTTNPPVQDQAARRKTLHNSKVRLGPR